jgi:hypothetical protein
MVTTLPLGKEIPVPTGFGAHKWAGHSDGSNILVWNICSSIINAVFASTIRVQVYVIIQESKLTEYEGMMNDIKFHK